MRKSRTDRNAGNAPFTLERREFVTLGLVLGATGKLPPVAFGSPVKQAKTIPHLRLGALEVSAIGLGCMSMNSGTYNPPREKQGMILLLHAAVDRGVIYFDPAEVYGPFVNEELGADPGWT